MKNIYTVAKLNSYIKNMFEQDFMLQSIYVKGEVSNCKYHSSGHIYFTLKDDKGTIACVMFAGNRAGLNFQMQEGQMVVVGGYVDIYERDGKYQLYAKEIILDGAGLLYERYEALKKELLEMGMFDDGYKQPIPKYISRLGVCTAPTGAAIRDIINIATRRNPYIQIILYPAIVQGEQAAESIVNGIHALEQLGVDVMIVGRGGGSIEDLWAFNERIVAEAVFNCQVPVISAVGHETDTTIIDYVSDLRAPTPSAAAELAVFDYSQFALKLAGYEQALYSKMNAQLVRQKKELDNLKIRMRYLSPASQIQERRTYLMNLESTLCDSMEGKLTDARHSLSIYIEQLKGLSPLEKLSQGYAFVENVGGRVINDVEKVSPEDELVLYVKNGTINTKVISTQKEVSWQKN